MIARSRTFQSAFSPQPSPMNATCSNQLPKLRSSRSGAPAVQVEYRPSRSRASDRGDGRRGACGVDLALLRHAHQTGHGRRAQWVCMVRVREPASGVQGMDCGQFRYRSAPTAGRFPDSFRWLCPPKHRRPPWRRSFPPQVLPECRGPKPVAQVMLCHQLISVEMPEYGKPPQSRTIPGWLTVTQIGWLQPLDLC